jgi:hypothetical protein
MPAKLAIPNGETANQITRNVLRLANFQPGCVAYRVNNVGVWDQAKGIHRKGNTEKGLPDVIMIFRGRFIAIEVKAGRDKLSDDQKKRQFEIERAGGIYFECRSTDDFINFLQNGCTKTL